jgi:hypothetical protein
VAGVKTMENQLQTASNWPETISPLAAWASPGVTIAVEGSSGGQTSSLAFAHQSPSSDKCVWARSGRQ